MSLYFVRRQHHAHDIARRQTAFNGALNSIVNGVPRRMTITLTQEQYFLCLGDDKLDHRTRLRSTIYEQLCTTKYKRG